MGKKKNRQKKPAAAAAENTALPGYARLPQKAICAFMILFTVFAVPFTETATNESVYYTPGGVFTDNTVFSREAALFVFAAGLLLFFAGERLFPDRPIRPALLSGKAHLPFFCAVGIYVFMAVISSVFSEYPFVCFWGAVTQHEGLAAVFGYAILAAAAYNYIYERDLPKLIRIITSGASLVITLMTLTEIFFGALPGLLFASESSGAGSELLFGNASVCGEVCALLIAPMLTFSLAEKHAVRRVGYSVLTGMLVLEVIRSASSAALYVSGAAAAAVLAVFLFKRTRLIAAASVIAAAAIPTCIFAVTQPAVFSSFIGSGASNSGTYDPSGSFGLTDIEVNGDTIVLRNDNAEAVIVLTDDSIDMRSEGDTSAVRAELNDGLLTLDLGYSEPIYFQATDGVFRYIGINGYLEDELAKPAFPQLSQYYGFATGRGYIWLTTASMLGNCIIKGYGAGEFVFCYPHNDIVGALNTHGTTAVITDKPHCMYLQIFAEYGLPALLAFLVIAVSVMKGGLRGVRSGSVEAAGLSVSAAAYLILGLVNDSCVISAVWFWLFSGIILGIAYKEKKVTHTNG